MALLYSSKGKNNSQRDYSDLNASSFYICFILLVFLLLSKKAVGQTYAWNNVQIGGGGFVTGIIPSKTQNGLMYARTDVGGAYRWDAMDSKWIPLLDWCSTNETGYQGVESLALDPQNAGRVYMLVGTSYFNGGKTAILRSTDYGASFSITDVSSQFTAHGNGMGRQNGERLAVDPNDANILFCGSRANGLWKSTNAGVSFTNVAFPVTTTPNANGINFIVFDPSGTVGNATQTFYVGVSRNTGTGANLYKTTNGGTSFTAITGGPNLMPQRAVLAADKNLYITFADNEGPWNINSGQVWKYNTNTNTWTNITPAGFTTGFGGISVDPGNSNRVIISTINAYWSQYVDASSNTVWGDRILLSTNGGTSWRDLVGTAGITMNANGCTWINGQSIHWAGSIEFNPFNTLEAWVVSGNGVFSCSDVSQTNTTWKFNINSLEETVPLDIVSITGGPLVSVIGDYDGFKHTNITAYSPIHNPRMGTTTGLAFAATNPNVLVRVGNSMYYSTNQGTSWTQTTSINGTKGKVAVSANGGIFLHNPEGSNTTYRSTNNGGTWTTCNGANVTDAVPVADMVNNNKFYIYNNGGGNLLVSTDGGVNFSTAGSPGTGAGSSKIIRTVPGQEGHIWVAVGTGGLKRSTNSGASFTTITNVTYCQSVGLGKAEPSSSYHTLYIWGTVGGVTGVFRSIDQGTSWVRVNDDAHEYGGPGNGNFVIGDMNVYGRVYMSTVGRGIVYGDIIVAAPVELLSFTANAKDNDVQLNWQTISETNNDYFEIEKSKNGKDFYVISRIEGAGNSSSLKQYNFLDETTFSGINYYRLKQVDLDGKYTYSETKAIHLDKTTTLSLFPNPVIDKLTLFFKENAMELTIIDVSGKTISTLKDIIAPEVSVDLSTLPRGVYFVKLVSEGKIEVKSFVKL